MELVSKQPALSTTGAWTLRPRYKVALKLIPPRREQGGRRYNPLGPFSSSAFSGESLLKQVKFCKVLQAFCLLVEGSREGGAIPLIQVEVPLVAPLAKVQREGEKGKPSTWGP